MPVEIEGEEIIIAPGRPPLSRAWTGEEHEPGCCESMCGLGPERARRVRAITATRSIWTRRGSARCSPSRPRDELGVKEETIRRDVGQRALAAGGAADEQIRKTLEPEEETIMIGEEEAAAALDLLRDPRLLDRILADFDSCGVVGEETNKRVSYLAAVSRLLEKPLADPGAVQHPLRANRR